MVRLKLFSDTGDWGRGMAVHAFWTVITRTLK